MPASNDPPITINSWKLDQLLEFVDTNSVVIPEFQRGFVWAQRDVKNLFDSMIKRFPIGSFIFWKTNQRIECREIFGNDSNSNSGKYFILDGQQRLFSLYYLLHQEKFPEISKLYSTLFEKSRKFIVKYDHFKITRTQDRKLVLDTVSESKQFDTRFFKKKLGKDYVFPAIIVNIDDYEKAIEIFNRINKYGTRISTEAIFLSAAWNKQSNFGKMLRDWKHNAKRENSILSKIETITFIHTLAIAIQLMQDKRVRTDISQQQLLSLAEKIRNGKVKNKNHIFRLVLKAVTRAVRFIKDEFKIEDLSQLPSNQLITVLSSFFLYKADASQIQEKEIIKWFWRSSLSSRYVGKGYTENMRKDPIQMMKLARHREKIRGIDKVKVKYSTLLHIDRKAGKSSLRNIIKLLFWVTGPKWIDGKPVLYKDIELFEKSKEDDHFYSYKYCMDRSISEGEANSILNTIFLGKSVNESKGKQQPSKWLKSQIEANEWSDSKVNDFFKSQLLPFGTLDDLKDAERRQNMDNRHEFSKYYQKFLKNRSEIIVNMLNRVQNGYMPQS